MNEAEGHYPNYQPSEPKEPPRDMKEFEKQSNEKLRPYKRQVVKTGYYDLLKWLVIIMAVGIVVLGYSAYDGRFKTEVNIPACPKIPEPIEIPPCPASSSTCEIECGDCNFPKNLSINLVNGTG